MEPTPDNQARHSVATATLQRVLDYLQQQPYAAVATLINEVMADARPIAPTPTVEPAPPPDAA